MRYFIDQHIAMELEKLKNSKEEKSLLLQIAYNPYVIGIISTIITAAIIAFLKLK